MKGIVAFLWKEYEDIHWQRNYEEQLSQAVSLTMLSDFPLLWTQLGMWCPGEKFHSGWRQSTLGAGLTSSVGSQELELERKEKKDDFLQLWDSKGKRNPKPSAWNVRKESLKDAPFQTSMPQRLSLILRFRFLKYLYCLLRHLPLYVQIKICSCANLQLTYISVESFGGWFIYLLNFLYHWYFTQSFCGLGLLLWCLGFFRGKDGLMGVFFCNTSICPILGNLIWRLRRIKKWCRSCPAGHWSLRSVWMQFQPHLVLLGSVKDIVSLTYTRLQDDWVGWI